MPPENEAPKSLPDEVEPQGEVDDSQLSRQAASPKQLDPEELQVRITEFVQAIARGGEVSIQRFSSGPLPHPEILNGYNDAVPNGAERIIGKWEAEGRHRQSMERRGQWIAGGLGISAITAAVVCAAIGAPWVGGAIVTATMIGIGMTAAIRLIR